MLSQSLYASGTMDIGLGCHDCAAGYLPRHSGEQDIGSSQGGEPRTSTAFVDTNGVPGDGTA